MVILLPIYLYTKISFGALNAGMLYKESMDDEYQY